MSRKRSRRANFTVAREVSIVPEHLFEGVPISDLCDRHGLKPNQVYSSRGARRPSSCPGVRGNVSWNASSQSSRASPVRRTR